MQRWPLLLLLPLLAYQGNAEILTPPYFNLAEGKEIIASATCGVDTPGPELYCKLVGANSDQDEDINLIQGQVCDYCDPDSPEKSHPPEHAVDGTETWWQSPPLSRGMKYNEVNLTINLGQEFHVAYVFVRMGNSPRPGLWILEKSSDYGKTWQPWQYFSDSANDCLTYFGVDSHTPITKDDSVICTTEYSKIVPLEGGEIPISILNNRPSASHYFNSTRLQEWTRATNVRFRFLRTKNLLGHLMSVARQDPTVTRRYFYSIKDISIGGRCMCNGHADTCDILDPNAPKSLVCRCQHNTCGPQCATCCKGFEQKKWRQSTAFKKFVCEPCNCFGHSDECNYDPEVDEKHLSLDIHGNYEGGGVCRNCRHNTEGTNCDRCKPKFYRPYGYPLNATDVCQPCNCDHFYSTGNCADSTGKCECRPEFTSPDCDSCSYGYFGYPDCRPCECHLNGTDGYQCEAREGSCPCKANYAGYYCNLCAEGYYNFPDCIPCECNPLGALNGICEVTSGNCTCKNNYGGRSCDSCEDGYYDYPSCTYCNCDTRGTKAGVCDKTDGRCICKEGYGGARCDRCTGGFYGYPNCRPCNCSSVGSSTVNCDINGKCSCLVNFAGKTCEQCSPGYYLYPECVSCNCDSHGAIGVSCSGEGKCQCRENFDGPNCGQCKEGYYNFPTCEGCNCDPAGVVETFLGCGSLPAGELCQCKERVEGRICNECKPLYWNLQPFNPKGCDECQCNVPGVIGGIAVCDSKTGQCICKPGVTDRSCSRCIDGTYDLRESNLFGCSDCACDIGGSVSPVCDKHTGQCLCQPRVTGLTCTEPLKAHYFPTFHQFKYEVEDGRTPSNSPVRYGFEEDIFPGYSWKGYAVFSALQDEIIQTIDIYKSSVYRMVLRYVNKNNEPVLGTIKITPDNPSEVEQVFKVQFKPSTKPTFVTVAGPHGNLPSPMVMNPGRWSVSIANKKSLFLDYFVLLPSEYYEATILSQDVNIPCEIGYKGLCRHYGYPSLTQFDSVRGEGGFLSENDVRIPLSEFYDERDTLEELGEDHIPLINRNQDEIHFELFLSRPGYHVLIMTYVTSKYENSTSTVLVEANTAGKGKVTLYPCKYTSNCKQVMTDHYGKVAVLNFPSNYVSIILTGEPSSNVGIISVTAVPYSKWSLDYIKPKSVCVRKNGKCVQGLFPSASDAKKIEFETSVEATEAEVRPPGIYDNSTKLIYLNSKDAMVDVPAKVPHPGEYVFVVQYFQPDHPEFDLGVLVQNGKFYEATVPVPHCPSNSGCRSTVRQSDGETRFQLIENFVITFKENTGNGIWLDYILVIPADQYNEKILTKIQFDQTKEFIKKCSNNHFHINITDEGFCRDSVFSLTANYNNGALPCQCDIDGTRSLECEKFGGQCPCKPNIIGRRCETCRTGFYGFPNCRPCNCPTTALCEPDTGACICPSRVTGELCDQCEPGTYGFDPLIGCEECNCSPLGVVDRDLQCDLLNGSCRCKENVVGRQCDKCAAGYSQFPHCEKCDCDVRGTTYDICDQYTAECFCKKNVQGLACDVCQEGSFNIQAGNEVGCTECFCFGKTTRCVSANVYRSYTIDMEDWDGVLINEKAGNVTILADRPKVLNETYIGYGLPTDESTVYFSVPDSYLGKKLTSYGGFLNYSIYYGTGPFGSAVGGADVVLYGADTYLFHFAEEQPPSYYNFRASVQIVESSFVTASRLPATREQIMVVLGDLRGIYLRATYWNPTLNSILSYVTLDVTTDVYAQNSVLASSVEQCICPPNYQGLSCEECAPGNYRVQSGLYGGICVRCQCNGHADTCDVDTGICHDCKNGTIGDHCEFCQEGYYGNATVGTPSDCLICACPLPVASNNFATGCEVNEDGTEISCDCIEGYYGARCESCAAGYFGNPEVYDEYCKPCECSGNIDTNEIGACDSVTGECLHCLNNTYGEACNLCKPGYFGDAVARKDCQSCFCDSCGMEKCDSYEGTCICRENVIGEKCDRCADDHYGFNSCRGCRPCDCGLASNSSQCDDSGQCRCKPGVTGRNCDRCIPGFWNYGADGCIACDCNIGYSRGVSCDSATGQCSCLPGVIGEKCDHCPHRFVFIEEEGCSQCDSCAHDLLDVADDLIVMLDPVVREFTTVAESYFTNQRLKFINDTVNDLYPKVQLLDPSRVNFLPLQQEISRLSQEVANQRRRVEYASEDGIKWKNGAEKTLNEMNMLEKDVIRETDAVDDIIAEVGSLVENIEARTGAKVDSALKEAQKILKEIQEVSFTAFRDNATDQADQANILVSEMIEYNLPTSNQTAELMRLSDKVKNYTARIDDLHNITHAAQELASEADKLNSENRLSAEFGNFDIVKNSTEEIQDDLLAGMELNQNASKYVDEASNNIMELERDTGGNARETLRKTIEDNDQALVDEFDRAKEAIDHAETLHMESLKLDDALTNTRNMSAVRAVSAYKEIEEAIRKAHVAALAAVQAANNATQLSDGVEDRTRNAQDKCAQLLSAARSALNQTKGQLKQKLRSAEDAVSNITLQNTQNRENLDRIEKALNNISPTQSSILLAHQYIAKAKKAEQLVAVATGDMSRYLGQLSEDVTESKKLSKDSSNSIRDISQASSQLDSVNKIVPNITNLLNNLGGKQGDIDRTGNDLRDKIDNLRRMIANSRELANGFKTGLTFNRNTILELKNPDSLPLLSTSTTISMYFRTNETNGFLLYLGNAENTKLPHTKTHDFMALMIESGYPVLVADFGSGPGKVIGTKFVSDNVWRQIIVERTGKNVKLIIREAIGNDKVQLYEKEQTLPGSYSIFNLDQEQSKLFVGGYPTSFQIQNAVTATSFKGEMEDLVIGDVPVSFWNFVYGENNRQGAYERDRLIDIKSSTGFRFDGNGYAIISREQNKIPWYGKSYNMVLVFKTFAEDGLIYLASKENKFVSLEMRGGKVLYQFDLGEGVAQLLSPKRYNDGSWHELQALRQDKESLLRIDGERVANNTAPGDNIASFASDLIYFGGLPPSSPHSYSSVTNSGFEGCIDNVTIYDISLDLKSNVQAFGVMSGCPARFANLVSFNESNPGFVRWNISVSNTLQLNLRFKTAARNGLIFYVTNKDRTAFSSLSIVDGLLVFKSPGVTLRSSSAAARFNDNEWHVVTASNNDNALRLHIDDTDSYDDSDSSPEPLRIDSGSLYIGGLPQSYISQEYAPELTPFTGCIGDATLNDVIINFANTTERHQAALGNCMGNIYMSSPAIHSRTMELPTTTFRIDEVVATTHKYDLNIETEAPDEEIFAGEGRPEHPHTEIEKSQTTSPPPTTTALPITTIKPTTLPPMVVDNCRLPHYPVDDPNPENAWRFGVIKQSRLEYNSLKGTYKNDYDLQIDVKTLSDEGIIFFSSSLNSQDLIAVYMKNGKIHYTFDCGSGPALLSSNKKINDNQWHTIVFRRQAENGELIVDELSPEMGSSQGHTKTMSVTPPFYVGGVLPEKAKSVIGLIGLNKTFNGCLGNLMMNGQPVGEPAVKIGVIPCSKRVEPGLFFYPGNGENFFRAIERFNGGTKIDIEMNIKPRAASGHLLSVHGRRDFVVLEMVNGTVKFIVKTIKGTIQTSFETPERNSLCDGEWHYIRAVKAKSAVLLSVDHKSATPGVSNTKEDARIVSRHPVFIGGHPLLASRKVRGSSSYSQYVGCMSDVVINKKRIIFDPERAHGQVIAGICPTI